MTKTKRRSKELRIDEKDYLTLDEVVDRLGVDRRKAMRIVNRHEIPVLRLTHKDVRIYREAFEKWIRSVKP